MRKLTTSEFIAQSKTTHGDLYGYSQSEYVHSKTPVCISCPDHGLFWQRPNDHLRGCGCPTCAGNASSNTTTFISKAQSVHGLSYSYSNSVYTNRKNKIIITCSIHGDFEQRSEAHLRGHGCPVCSGDRARDRLSIGLDSFIARSSKIHRQFYDYSRVEYVNVMTKVIVLCPDHGSFAQTPMAHLRGQGCPSCAAAKCSIDQQLTSFDVLKLFKKAHGDVYDYSSVVYSGRKRKVRITCKIHGNFDQIAENHMSGHGCPKCASESSSNILRMPVHIFCEKARAIHIAEYDYSKVSFKQLKDKVTIGCLIHGEFSQRAEAHLRGHGCSICNHGGSYSSSPTMLYYLRVYVRDIRAYKIGITIHDIHTRYQNVYDRNAITVLATKWYRDGHDAYNAEQSVLRDYAPYRYCGEKLLNKGGNTEMFNIDILGLDNVER